MESLSKMVLLFDGQKVIYLKFYSILCVSDLIKFVAKYHKHANKIQKHYENMIALNYLWHTNETTSEMLAASGGGNPCLDVEFKKVTTPKCLLQMVRFPPR